MNIKDNSGNNRIMQDIGLLLLLACLFAASLITAIAPEAVTLQYLVMLVFLFLTVLLCAYKVTYLATVFAGLEVLGFLAYKIYSMSANGETILASDYVWLFLPMLALGSMLLFLRAGTAIELANELLREQVDELVMINPLTGLYNLRAMYNDLSRESAYSDRHGLAFSLMLIRLRYERELRAVLSANAYRQLLQRLASLTEDCLRREDRLYSIDSSGSMAVIITADICGAQVAAARIKDSIAHKDAFSGIVKKAVKVEIVIGIRQYEHGSGSSPQELFRRAESELQYDV